jgi:hypothetical protein
LQSKGNDEIEEFAINKWKISTIPSLLVYTPQQKDHQQQQLMDVVADSEDTTDMSCWTSISDFSEMPLSEYNFPLQSRHVDKKLLDQFLQLFCHQQEDTAIPAELLPPPTAVFVAGDRSSVGKTSMCMSIMASLIQRG